MERTKKPRRIWWAGVGMVVLALIVVAIWRLWPRERLLMEVARPITMVDNEKDQVCWLSTHQLLIGTRARTWVVIHRKNGHMVVTIKPLSLGSADFLDTDTRVRTHLKGLTPLFKKMPPESFETSPDGNWLLWDTSTERLAGFSLQSVHLDGTCYREWEHSRDVEDSFYADAHHLVRIPVKESQITVLDLLDPRKDRRNLQPEQRQAIIAQYAAQKLEFGLVDASDQTETKGFATIKMYRAPDRLCLLLSPGSDNREEVQPVLTRKIRLPVGAELRRGEVSPTQQSVFYDLHVTRTNPFLSWLHRILPTFDLKSNLTQGLWVSQTKRGEMYEIGHVPLKLDANGNLERSVESIQWLPNGKQISFVYHGTLYVVPAEPGK